MLYTCTKYMRSYIQDTKETFLAAVMADIFSKRLWQWTTLYGLRGLVPTAEGWICMNLLANYNYV